MPTSELACEPGANLKEWPRGEPSHVSALGLASGSAPSPSYKWLLSFLKCPVSFTLQPNQGKVYLHPGLISSWGFSVFWKWPRPLALWFECPEAMPCFLFWGLNSILMRRNLLCRDGPKVNGRISGWPMTRSCECLFEIESLAGPWFTHSDGGIGEQCCKGLPY